MEIIKGKLSPDAWVCGDCGSYCPPDCIIVCPDSFARCMTLEID